jgi:general secretion pathway protein D
MKCTLGSVRLLTLLVALVLYVPQVLGSTVSLLPATTNAGIGQNVSMSLAVSDISDLYAFQFDLLFNPAVLQASSVSEGAFLQGGGSTLFDPGTINNTAGSISLVFDTLVGPVSGVNGSSQLASIQFTTLAAGQSTVELSNALFIDSALSTIDVDFTNAQVNVSEVIIPEPRQVIPVACLLGILLFLVRDRLLLHAKR